MYYNFNKQALRIDNIWLTTIILFYFWLFSNALLFVFVIPDSNIL